MEDKCKPIQPVIQVLAMSRSGHHAYLEWFINNLGGTCVHHNYVRNGVPTQCFLYQDGDLVGETHDPVPDGAWETANVENQLPTDPMPFNCKTIIFMRDVYNCMASRIKANKGVVRHTTLTQQKGVNVEAWIAQAKEALRITKHIDNPIVVKYNEWRDKANWSRESVAYNRGSSFGTIEGVDERWKEFLAHPLYQSVINNPEAAELNEQLFGWRLP